MVDEVFETAAADAAAREGERPGRDEPARPCPNCGDATPGSYCPTCGQRRIEVRQSMRVLVRDVLEDQFSLDAKLPRTLKALLFQPGQLTLEYARGRIARYIFPFRLYLLSSIVFFLLLSFLGGGLDLQSGVGEDAAPAAAEQAAEGVATAESALEALDSPGAGMEGREGEPPAAGEQAEPAGSGAQDDAAARVADEEAETEADAETEAEPASPADDNWTDNISVSTPWPALTALLQQRIRRFGEMEPDAAFREVMEAALDIAPTAVFLLLPVFALLMKLLYIRRSRYYVEHFVFALHTHAFTFLAFTAMLLWRNGIFVTVAWIWILAYYFVALKRVYGQGYIKTGLKYATLGFFYALFLVPMTVALAFIAAIVVA